MSDNLIQIDAAPEFPVTFELVGPGHTILGKLTITCRALTRTEFDERVTAGEARAVMRDIVIGWAGVSKPFSPETFDALCDRYPGAPSQMLREYTRALFATERKN